MKVKEIIGVLKDSSKKAFYITRKFDRESEVTLLNGNKLLILGALMYKMKLSS